jgi:hypothetical protein
MELLFEQLMALSREPCACVDKEYDMLFSNLLGFEVANVRRKIHLSCLQNDPVSLLSKHR